MPRGKLKFSAREIEAMIEALTSRIAGETDVDTDASASESALDKLIELRQVSWPREIESADIETRVLYEPIRLPDQDDAFDWAVTRKGMGPSGILCGFDGRPQRYDSRAAAFAAAQGTAERDALLMALVEIMDQEEADENVRDRFIYTLSASKRDTIRALLPRALWPKGMHHD